MRRWILVTFAEKKSIATKDYSVPVLSCCFGWGQTRQGHQHDQSYGSVSRLSGWETTTMGPRCYQQSETLSGYFQIEHQRGQRNVKMVLYREQDTSNDCLRSRMQALFHKAFAFGAVVLDSLDVSSAETVTNFSYMHPHKRSNITQNFIIEYATSISNRSILKHAHNDVTHVYCQLQLRLYYRGG